MQNNQEKVLILGAGGMLGNALLRYLHSKGHRDVVGTVRSANMPPGLSEVSNHIITDIDVMHVDSLIKVFAETRPDVVINCIGVVKQASIANDPICVIPINSLLPHRLASLSKASGARLIHISTDCVFSGKRGAYVEEDFPDAEDLYGRSKLIGEVNQSESLTIRTSIIGHELRGARGLVNWFLSQEGAIKGYKSAIFSGLPSVEIARIIEEHILPNPELQGLYHLSADPINKYELLELVAEIYGKKISIIPDETLKINRSLDSSRFRDATGFTPRPWRDMVRIMRDFG